VKHNLNQWGEKNPYYKHGQCKTRLYNIWGNMIWRCENPKASIYYLYGGRGITVCEEWRKDFKTFWIWANNNGYSDELSLDRIDNDKGYSPDNCRWATQIEQSNNKRTNQRITINGETHTIAEWARIAGILKTTLRERIQRGWTGERLLIKTSEKKHKYGTS